MSLDSRKDIQSAKSAWSILDTEPKAHILPFLEGNIEGCKTNN